MAPTAFVTGATGFIGRNLTEQLCDHGWQVTALCRPSSDVVSLRARGVSLAEGEITDRSSVLEEGLIRR
jgi:uncharacterized protein YbjT (DUF2867 family)